MFDIAKLREIIEKSKYMIPKSLAAVETLVFISFRVLGEPAFADAFALFEEFQYRPETRETENAEQHGNVDVFHEERAHTACNS